VRSLTRALATDTSTVTIHVAIVAVVGTMEFEYVHFCPCTTMVPQWCNHNGTTMGLDTMVQPQWDHNGTTTTGPQRDHNGATMVPQGYHTTTSLDTAEPML